MTERGEGKEHLEISQWVGEEEDVRAVAKEG